MPFDAWPFLVSRSERLGYQVIVAPDFMLEAGCAGLLEDRTVGEADGAPIHRFLPDSGAGPLTLVYRIRHAELEGEPVTDAFNRPIESTEGLVVKGHLPGDAIGTVQLREIQSGLADAYRRFWGCGEKPPPVPSSSRTVDGVAGATFRAAPAATAPPAIAAPELPRPERGATGAPRPARLVYWVGAAAMALLLVVAFAPLERVRDEAPADPACDGPAGPPAAQSSPPVADPGSGRDSCDRATIAGATAVRGGIGAEATAD